MPKVNISPQATLLTAGQAITFNATDELGKPILVKWTLNPANPLSLAAPAVDTLAPSATYVAPPTVGAAQTIAIIASIDSDSASAIISLTPDAISIVPAKVTLKAREMQQFIAIVAGPATGIASAPPTDLSSTEKITWILSPPVGELDQDGRYNAPPEIPDSTTVNVIATSKVSGKQGIATVNLSSPPWTGRGVQLLGIYLFLVFTLVFLMILLWPPALPSPDTAKANRIEAEKTLEQKTSELEKAETAKAQVQLARIKAESNKPSPSNATQAASKIDGSVITVDEAQAESDAASYAEERADQARKFAEKDVQKKRDDEDKVNAADIYTKLGKMNRELNLLCLVLLAGCLGSFLHMAQSFSDYVGNRTIKSNWAWWYYFRPFIGAGLALVFYASMRGGFMAIATGSNAKASELNPFGLVGVAALAGMFSKAATMKLGEVFDTLFQSSKATETKDKLDHTSQASTQPTTTTAGAPAAATTK